MSETSSVNSMIEMTFAEWQAKQRLVNAELHTCSSLYDSERTKEPQRYAVYFREFTWRSSEGECVRLSSTVQRQIHVLMDRGCSAIVPMEESLDLPPRSYVQLWTVLSERALDKLHKTFQWCGSSTVVDYETNIWPHSLLSQEVTFIR